MSPSKRDAAIVLAIHLIAGLLFLSPSYIRPDSVGVMSWLRSAAVDGDLLFFDEWGGFGMLGDGFAWFKEVTPAGALANHWWIGTAIVTSPFWGVSHLVSIALPGKVFPDDGFFGLDLVTLGWTSVLLGALSLLFAARVVREAIAEANGRDLALALGMTAVGTPLFWYVFRMPIGTHAAGAMLVGALTFLSWRLLTKPEDVSPVLLGLVFGLATVTRLQHLLLLPAVLYATFSAGRSTRFHLRFALGSLVPLAAQGAAWHAVYGTPLGPLARGANLEGVTWMPLRSIELVSVLVSPWHGLLSWSPLVVLSFFGGLALYRSEGPGRRLAIVLALMFGGELLANSALDRYWWGGMGFGARRFVDLAAPFAIGLAAAFRTRARVAALMSALAASAWSVALMLAATAGTLSLSRWVSWNDLARAVADAPSAASLAHLRSPVTDANALGLSFVALAIVAFLAGAWRVLAPRFGVDATRGVAALAAIALVASAMLVSPTRARADAERARHGLQGEAARAAGPLIDQRGLLDDEAAWLAATGRLARRDATLKEIDAITARLRQLGVE